MGDRECPMRDVNPQDDERKRAMDPLARLSGMESSGQPLRWALKGGAVPGEGVVGGSSAGAFNQQFVVDEMRPPRVRTAGTNAVVCKPQEHFKTLSFVDFLECICRCADMRLRGERQGSLPWDEDKEGPEVKLADVLDEFLEEHLLRNRKVKLKNAILKVQSITALTAPARLKELIEERRSR